MIKVKIEKKQITNIKNEVMDIITDPVAIKKEYYKQLYTHKSDNLEEMVQYVEHHKVPGVGRKKGPHTANILILGNYEYVIL